MDEVKKKKLRNHIPTVKKLCDIFIIALDSPEEMDPGIENAYLLELIDKMEVQLTMAKGVIQQ